MTRLFTVALLLGAMAAQPHAQAPKTVYVDISNPNALDSNFGTSIDPWRNLEFALDTNLSNLNPGDTIRVRSGNYDSDPLTDPGAFAISYPLTIPDDINIEGVNLSDQSPSPAERPRFGGGLAGVVTHLFEIDASSSTVAPGTISRIRCVGEDVPGLDSPIAIKATASGDHEAILSFDDVIFERPHMNASGASGLATVHIEADDGRVTGNISNSIIQTSDRGGIEMISIQDTGPSKWGSRIDVGIVGNSISNPGGLYSQFAVKWIAPDLDGPPQLTGGPAVCDNTILARGGNIQNGIVFHADEDTHGGTGFTIARNVVDGCALSGVVLRVDGDDKPGTTPDSVPELVVNLALNVVLNSGESGMRFIWDERDHSADHGLGYLSVELEGNLVAGSEDYALVIHNFTDDSMGTVRSQANTLVYNELGALHFSNLTWASPLTSPEAIEGLDSEIVYFNNPGDETGPWQDQVIGLTSDQYDDLRAMVTFSDWYDIGSFGSNNLDVDPLLVEDVNGWFHLTKDSLCIDAGWNDINQMFDIDGDTRIPLQDGNCDGTAQVDMGADEFPERCP